MKILKKIITSKIIWIMAGLLILASGSTEEKPSVIEIEWWNITSRTELSQRAAADFNAENPDIKISAVLNPTSDHHKKLLIAAQSNTLPDIWFNWVGNMASFYVENDISYNLSDYAKENNWDNKFSSTALNLATFDGKLGGYPTKISMIGMFYRKDIFDECGLRIPNTFEEFENILATLKSKGYTPLILCGKNGWHAMRFVEALIEMYAGSEEHDRITAGKSSWNQEAVIKAFTNLREYIEKGYLPEAFTTLSGNDARILLYTGKGVIEPDGPWQESNIFSDKQEHNKFGYFKLPLSREGNRMSGFVEITQFNTNLSKEKLEAAMKFIDWLYSSESVLKYGDLIRQPVPRLDNKLPENFTLTLQMIEDQIKYGSFTISDMALPQEIAIRLFDAQDALAKGTMTPKEAAEFMAAGADKYYRDK